MSDKDESDIIEHLNVGRGLRLIKTPERKHPEPSPELKAIVEDLNRHARAHRERRWREPDGKDAA